MELTKAWKAERWALWWTAGWLAALSLVWSGHKVLGYIITKRLTELLLIGGPLEANRYFIRMAPWIHYSRTVVNVMAFVFLCSLIWWLLATRHRRALHPAGIATRDR